MGDEKDYWIRFVDGSETYNIPPEQFKIMDSALKDGKEGCVIKNKAGDEIIIIFRNIIFSRSSDGGE
ncbi:MAG: hypothetical protein PHG05_04030 [Candidatus Nanoarchaeia archaeon]|nr:hypothetical protein [Candidatus Nanoarchaeia archaeon]